MLFSLLVNMALSVLLLLDFFLFMKDFAGNFSLIVVMQALSRWLHSASSLADPANSS